MKIREIVSALERFAPVPLQDDFDNSGLQIGTTQAETSGALLCLDVTPQVIQEAVRLGCNLVISHHPLLFRPMKRICDSDFNGQTAMMAIKNDITLYACHTNLDNAVGGVSFRMAKELGLKDCQVLEDKGNGSGAGVIGEFESATDEQVMLETIKRTFKTGVIRHNAALGRKIKRLALCGGAGSFLIDKALEMKADAFLTGEISYHRFFGYDGQLKLIEAGHFETEQYTVQLLHELLARDFPDLKLYDTNIATNPINYYI